VETYVKKHKIECGIFPPPPPPPSPQQCTQLEQIMATPRRTSTQQQLPDLMRVMIMISSTHLTLEV